MSVITDSNNEQMLYVQNAKIVVSEESVGSKIIAESNGDDLGELMGYDKWPDELATAFERDRGIVISKFVKNRKSRTFTFDEVITEFRTLEAKYVEHFGDNAENAQQVERITAEMLLKMTWILNEPFGTSQMFWHELQELGFYRIEREINDARLFAEICREHGQTDLGLQVLDPVIAEVERLRAKPDITQWAGEYYEQELGYMRKLRVRLETDRNAPKETL